MLQSGIYMIKNIVNGTVYIGQTNNINRRKKEHFYSLRHGRSFNSHLQYSWNKYGENSFVFYVLEYCDIYELGERESFWIKYYKFHKNIYNMNDGGVSGNIGYIPTPETCKKISDSLTGKKKSDSHKQKMSENAKKYFSEHLQVTSIKVILLNENKVFNTLKDASKYLGVSKDTIKRHCENKTPIIKNDRRYYFLLLSDFTAYKSDCKNVLLKLHAEHRKSMIVCLNNLKVYNNSKEANTKLNFPSTQRSAIASCLNDTRNVVNFNNTSYIFVYFNDYIKLIKDVDMVLDIINCRISKSLASSRSSLSALKTSVKVVDLNSNFVYDSIAVASRATGVAKSTIGYYCKGNRDLNNKKYRFMYFNQYINFN